MVRHNRSSGGAIVRLLNVVLFYITLCAVFMPLIVLGMGDVGFLSAILILPCFALGYFSSGAASVIFGFERKRNTNAYESEEKYFEFHKAILPLVLSVVLSVAYSYYVAKLLLGLSEALAGTSIDIHYGAVPTVIFAISCAATGAVVWFFPSERLCGEKTCMVFVGVMLGVFIVLGYLGMNVSYTFVFLALFTLAALFALGQNSLSEGNSDGTVSFINKRMRGQYALVSLAVILLLAVCFVVTASIFSGIYVLFRSFLFRILNMQSSNDPYVEYSTGEITKMYNLYVYHNEDAASSPLFYFFIIFVILCIFCILYLLLRRSKEVRGFFSELWRGIARLFRALLDLLRGKHKSAELYTVAVSYRDIEKKVSEPHIGRAGAVCKRAKSYKGFINELESLPDVDTRLVYSYVTLVGIVKGMQLYVKPSDTPREICEKIKRSPGFSEMSGITEAFEQVYYAGHGLDAEKGNDAVKIMCRMIRAHMED